MATADAETVLLSVKRLHELLDELLAAGAPHAFVTDALTEATLRTLAYGRGEPVLTESLAGHAYDLLTALKGLLAALNDSRAAQTRAILNARAVISRAEVIVVGSWNRS